MGDATEKALYGILIAAHDLQSRSLAAWQLLAADLLLPMPLSARPGGIAVRTREDRASFTRFRQ
ncbi:hypothetical protein [Actinomadura fibrosa]|uniref:hypothetical protein n=1 Tax=Actinomadura fibrosa TaxID=111802 RepID=UPI00104124E1|nr:hypothetical protein [Actinomadura fibrosa]